MTKGRGYQIVDADTGRPVRVSLFSAETVVRALYQRLADFPSRDFRILDWTGRPVSVNTVVGRLWAEDTKWAS